MQFDCSVKISGLLARFSPDTRPPWQFRQ